MLSAHSNSVTNWEDICSVDASWGPQKLRKLRIRITPFVVLQKWRITFKEKGYIAVDGISLTVGERLDGKGSFAVHIIPETLRLTTLGNKSEGDRCNIEIDAMTQAVVETTKRMMQQREA